MSRAGLPGRPCLGTVLFGLKAVRLERPRRCGYTNVCFRVCSGASRVPELVNFHSNLKPWSAVRTHEHTPSPDPPPRGYRRTCTLACIYSPLHSLYHRDSQATYFFTSAVPVLALYPDLKGVLSPLLFPVFSILSPQSFLSLFSCLATNPPTHSMNMLAHKHRF